MNTRPEPQKYLMYVSYFIAGVLGLGGLIGAINDTLDLITLRISIVGTVLIVVSFIGAQFYLKRFPWHTQAGRVTKLGVGTAVYLLGMIALLWLPQILELMPPPLEFEPAAEGEALIIIATFHRTEGVVDVAAHDEIGRAIQQKIDDLKIQNVRVAIESTSIQSGNQNEAEKLGNRYDASLIIWGSDTGVRLEINFLSLKERDFAAAKIIISETISTQLARPDAYSQFITEDLPSLLTYLTLYALSNTEFNQRNYKQATDLIENAIDSIPNELEIDGELIQLNSAYHYLGVLQHISQNYSEAILNYNQSIAINPVDAEVYYNRGLAYIYLGEFQKAIADNNQVISLEPDNANAYHNRGSAYGSLGNYEQAIADLDTAISLNEDLAELYYNRGKAYHELGNFEKAITNYSDAIVRDPDHYLAFNNRGLAYSYQGNVEKAIADFSEAIIIEPKHLAAYINRAQVYASIGEFAEALTDYDQALAIDPEFATIYYNRADTLEKLGEYQKAIEDYSTAIALEPDLIVAYIGRGAIYGQLGNYGQAIFDFDQVISLNPNYSLAYFNKGNALLSARTIQRSGKCISNLFRTHSKYAATRRNRNSYSSTK